MLPITLTAYCYVHSKIFIGFPKKIVDYENAFNAPFSMYLILKNEASAKINVKLLKSDRET